MARVLEKIVTLLGSEFTEFYGTQKIHSVVHSWPLPNSMMCQINPVHRSALPHCSLSCILYYFLQCVGIPSVLFPSGFLNRIFFIRASVFVTNCDWKNHYTDQDKFSLKNTNLIPRTYKIWATEMWKHLRQHEMHESWFLEAKNTFFWNLKEHIPFHEARQ